MSRLFNNLFLVATVSVFLLNGTVLDLIGWRFSDDSGPLLTRIHPSSYLILFVTILAAISFPKRVAQTLSNPAFIVYNAAVLIMFARAIAIMMTGITGGEVTTVITNFLTPGLFYLCARCVNVDELRKLEMPLRYFFIVNSLMALAERLAGHRFLPGFLDRTTDQRSAALVAHPLNGSMLTGLMLVYLVTARRGATPIANRMPEILLHAAAMFAFGGRSALVFTPTVLILSAILGRRKAGEANLTWQQRALPLSIVALGLGMIFLPIDFVDQTLDRFSQDGNSAQTRNAAVEILFNIPSSDLLWGMNMYDRLAICRFYGTPAGLELAWASLISAFGLLATLPMMVGLPWLFYTMTKGMDRSAFYMVILFIVVTAGSLAFGVKSLLVVQCVMMMQMLSQRKMLSIGTNLFSEMGIASRSRREPQLRGGLSTSGR